MAPPRCEPERSRRTWGGVGVWEHEDSGMDAKEAAEFADDKPTRFDFRPPELDDTHEEEPLEPPEEEEVEVPMMSVEEALRAPDPSLSFDDHTVEHEMQALSPTGEGEDEFDSATVPTDEPEGASELAEVLSPDGVDPRTVDPRGPTTLRPEMPAINPPPSRAEPPGRPSLPPDARPAWRAPAIERQAPSARSLQVMNRASLAPLAEEDVVRSSDPPPARSSKSAPPGPRPSKPPPTDRSGRAPNAGRASLPPGLLRLSETGDLRIHEHVETAKRTAKILPIAIGGGITIAFLWVSFGGGSMDGASEAMKREAADVYASRAAVRSGDKEHAADPLIRIESDPPGARVEVNNVEIGRTPLLAPSPYTNAEYFLVVLRDGQDPWHGYLHRDSRVPRRIEAVRQRYEGTATEVPRDKNGIAYVKVTLRAAK